MIVVVADTSGLIAARSADDPEGPGAREALRQAGHLVISPLLLSEFDHLATREFGRPEAMHAIDDLRARLDDRRAEMPIITSRMLGLAHDIRRQYRDLDLDLTDAVNVVIAAEYETDAILTLDRRDFRAIRPLAQFKAFRLLPDDL
ncbi:PIN domain-containing protein [Glycomyces artemisiae]|uniref:Putative nucleic acid-binding protein n=1 Tax=Glycomyces artemisiae TaxID=1076443 RepID=A0A2T0UTA5_9ACTN|nr:PIN domain-containing protein [Glycomyces artemisiae]PRY61146.1 putative nucleic acid-binding protein [Glycomyces artemisiae]